MVEGSPSALASFVGMCAVALTRFALFIACFFLLFLRSFLLATAPAGTSRVSGVPARAFVTHDGGEAPGSIPERRIQRGGGAEGPQKFVRAPQGVG